MSAERPNMETFEMTRPASVARIASTTTSSRSVKPRRERSMGNSWMVTATPGPAPGSAGRVHVGCHVRRADGTMGLQELRSSRAPGLDARASALGGRDHRSVLVERGDLVGGEVAVGAEHRDHAAAVAVVVRLEHGQVAVAVEVVRV